MLAPQWPLAGCAGALLRVERGPRTQLVAPPGSAGGRRTPRGRVGLAGARRGRRRQAAEPPGEGVITLTDSGNVDVVATSGEHLFHVPPSTVVAPPPPVAKGAVHRGRARARPRRARTPARVALAGASRPRCVAVGRSSGELELVTPTSEAGASSRRLLRADGAGAPAPAAARARSATALDGAAITCVCVLPSAGHMLLTGLAEGELRLWCLSPGHEKPCLWATPRTRARSSRARGRRRRRGAATARAPKHGDVAVVSAGSGGVGQALGPRPTGRALTPAGYFLVRGQLSALGIATAADTLAAPRRRGERA